VHLRVGHLHEGMEGAARRGTEVSSMLQGAGLLPPYMSSETG
jgi:hypothetical protein